MTTQDTPTPATSSPADTGAPVAADTGATSPAPSEPTAETFHGVPACDWPRYPRILAAVEARRIARTLDADALAAKERADGAKAHAAALQAKAHDAGEDSAVASAQLRAAQRDHEDATSRRDRDRLAAVVDECRDAARRAEALARDLAESAATAATGAEATAAHAARRREAAHDAESKAEVAEQVAMEEVQKWERDQRHLAALAADADEAERLTRLRDAVPRTRCIDCVNWMPLPGDPKRGYCHRNPPTVLATSGGSSFPTTAAAEFCGAGEPIPATA